MTSSTTQEHRTGSPDLAERLPRLAEARPRTGGARLFGALFFLGLVLIPQVADAMRIEELCDVRGVRQNQLVGYGLVVGLQGTGDSRQSPFSIQAVVAALRRLGATVDQSTINQTKNAAAVLVTASLAPYANPGTRIDVHVSSIGDARSLEGGTLIQTPLYGADREVYAVAQGALVLGGFSASGGGASVRENHTTAARVPQGAIVERRVQTPAVDRDTLMLTLRTPSFVTAQRIVDAIDHDLGHGTAVAIDSGTVRVTVPTEFQRSPVTLIARLQVLDVVPDAPVRVVIDERTGTIVLGAGVRISEVAIAQGGLTVQVTRVPLVSQPNPLGRGETTVVEETEVSAEVRPSVMHHLPTTASLADVVAALNALGATPRDLVSVFQALRTAGALHADVEVQ